MRVKLMNEREVLDALKKAGIAPRTVLDAAVKAAAVVIRDEAQRKAPGPGIEVAQAESAASSVTYHVGPKEDKWHYKFLETGTPPHRIRPKNRKALKLIPLGEVFAAGASHPGMAARPFLRPAIDTKANAARDAAGQAIKRALDG